MSSSPVSQALVGRSAQLATLRDTLSRAIDHTTGLVVIGGEAGSGKSRLVAETATGARELGFRVLIGGCLELGNDGLPFAPLVEALRVLARSSDPEALERVLGPARGELARLLPELADTDAAVAPTIGSAAALLDRVHGVLTRLTREGPLLLVVEDLHWADRSTLDLLTFLVRTLRDVPLVMLATYRTDEVHRGHALRPLLAGWGRLPAVELLDLPRLDRAEVVEQVAAICAQPGGPAPVTTALVDIVFERSQGNPYLVEELMAAVAAGAEASALPPLVRDLLLTRVEALSAPSQELLRVAATGGARIPERLLTAVCGSLGLDAAALGGCLREVVEHHVLVVDEQVGGYAFRHALARDAVYADMLPGERTRLHAAYGAVLEDEPELAGPASSSAAALAHHWYAAHELGAALQHAVLAAAEARAAYAPAEALLQLERALEIWPRVPDATERVGLAEPEIAQRAADAALRAGYAPRALAWLDHELAAAEVQSDPVRRARAMSRRALVLRDLGRTPEALDDLAEAVRLLGPSAPDPALAEVLSAQANTLMRASDMAAAQEAARSAAAAAQRASLPGLEADALTTLGTALAYSGEGPAGLESLRRALSIALEGTQDEHALRAYVNISDALQLAGRYQEAAEAAATGAELAQDVGLARTYGAYLVANRAEALVALGDWDGAGRLIDDSLDAGLDGVYASSLLELAAQLAVLRGDHRRAEVSVAEARRVLGPAPDAQYTLPLAFTDGERSRAAGDLPTAWRCVVDALGAVEPNAWGGRYTWRLVWLGARLRADAALAAADLREAPDPWPHLQLVDDVWTQLMEAGPTAYAALVEAERRRGEGEPGPVPWQAAVDAWRSSHEPYFLAYALYRLAEAFATEGDRSAASAAAGEALAWRPGWGRHPCWRSCRPWSPGPACQRLTRMRSRSPGPRTRLRRTRSG